MAPSTEIPRISAQALALIELLAFYATHLTQRSRLSIEPSSDNKATRSVKSRVLINFSFIASTYQREQDAQRAI